MMWRPFVAVAVGGMLGCLLRWGLAVFLNRYFPDDSSRDAGGESHRLLHHRNGRRLLHDLSPFRP